MLQPIAEGRRKSNDYPTSDDPSATPVIVSVRLRPLNEKEFLEAKKKYERTPRKKIKPLKSKEDEREREAEREKKRRKEQLMRDTSDSEMFGKESITSGEDVDEDDEREAIEEVGEIWTVEKVADTDIVVQKNCARRQEGKNIFTFDSIYDQIASIDWVYYGVARPILKSVLDGKHGTIFTYGQTGSGKTYTMHGEAKLSGGEEGILQMAVRELFEHIEGEQKKRDFIVYASYFEVYNEQVRDLLGRSDTTDDKNLTLSEGQDHSVVLPVLNVREDAQSGEVDVDAQSNEVKSLEDVVKMIQIGHKNRACAQTEMNAQSSRSHAIFRLRIKSQRKIKTEELEQGPKGPMRVLSSVLNFVDLAGSESASRSNTGGKRTREGGKINQSLLSLTQVISQLSLPAKKKPKFINYRDSKLTRILQPHLSGNGVLAVLCCASAYKDHLEETRSTLKFAAGAKKIKMKPVVNEVIDDKAIISKLQQELKDTRDALKELQQNQQQPPPSSEPMKNESSSSNYYDAHDRTSRLLGGSSRSSSGVFEDEEEPASQQFDDDAKSYDGIQWEDNDDNDVEEDGIQWADDDDDGDAGEGGILWVAEDETERDGIQWAEEEDETERDGIQWTEEDETERDGIQWAEEDPTERDGIQWADDDDDDDDDNEDRPYDGVMRRYSNGTDRSSPPQRSPQQRQIDKINDSQIHTVLTSGSERSSFASEKSDGYGHIFGSDSGSYEHEAAKGGSYSHIFGKQEGGEYEDALVPHEEIFQPDDDEQSEEEEEEEIYRPVVDCEGLDDHIDEGGPQLSMEEQLRDLRASKEKIDRQLKLKQLQQEVGVSPAVKQNRSNSSSSQQSSKAAPMAPPKESVQNSLLGKSPGRQQDNALKQPARKRDDDSYGSGRGGDDGGGIAASMRIPPFQKKNLVESMVIPPFRKKNAEPEEKKKAVAEPDGDYERISSTRIPPFQEKKAVVEPDGDYKRIASMVIPPFKKKAFAEPTPAATEDQRYVLPARGEARESHEQFSRATDQKHAAPAQQGGARQDQRYLSPGSQQHVSRGGQRYVSPSQGAPPQQPELTDQRSPQQKLSLPAIPPFRGSASSQRQQTSRTTDQRYVSPGKGGARESHPVANIPPFRAPAAPSQQQNISDITDSRYESPERGGAPKLQQKYAVGTIPSFQTPATSAYQTPMSSAYQSPARTAAGRTQVANAEIGHRTPPRQLEQKRHESGITSEKRNMPQQETFGAGGPQHMPEDYHNQAKARHPDERFRQQQASAAAEERGWGGKVMVKSSYGESPASCTSREGTSREEFENEMSDDGIDVEYMDGHKDPNQAGTDETLVTDYLFHPIQAMKSSPPLVAVPALGRDEDSETSELSLEAAMDDVVPGPSQNIVERFHDAETSHTKQLVKYPSSKREGGIPPGEVVVMMDPMMEGGKDGILYERLRQAEQRAEFLEQKLEETEDLVESLFLELENARKFIRELVSRMPRFESDAKEMESVGVMLADELILRQFTLLKYAIYVSLAFYLIGQSELFLATVMFLWLTLEVATY